MSKIHPKSVRNRVRQAILKTLGVDLSPEAVRSVFKAADLNGDDKLDMEEYEKLVRKAMPLKAS